MRNRLLAMIAASITSACTPGGGSTDARGETTTSSATPKPALLAPVAFEGDCSVGPPMGQIRAYAGGSATLVSSSTDVRVRSCPVWPADDLSNVLGVLPSGARIPVFGPLKHESWGAGIGYAVPLVDPRGVECRGYVSATVLDHIEAHAQTGYREALPLPDARAAWTGPCLLPGEPPRTPVRAGYMWWSPGETLDRYNAVMIAVVRVESLRSHPSDNEHREGPLIDATFAIREVLFHRPSIATRVDAVAYDYAGESTLEISDMSPTTLAVGDMLLIFLSAYEAGYAVSGVLGTNSELGIRLEAWNDPVIELARRKVAGALPEQEFYAEIERIGRARGWDSGPP
jgi:hypothetical protein